MRPSATGSANPSHQFASSGSGGSPPPRARHGSAAGGASAGSVRSTRERSGSEASVASAMDGVAIARRISAGTAMRTRVTGGLQTGRELEANPTRTGALPGASIGASPPRPPGPAQSLHPGVDVHAPLAQEADER